MIEKLKEEKLEEYVSKFRQIPVKDEEIDIKKYFLDIKEFISQSIDSAYQAGQEAKLSKTFQSSKMYQMGYKDGRDNRALC